jgi:hypothetical protein
MLLLDAFFEVDGPALILKSCIGHINHHHPRGSERFSRARTDF